MTTEQTQPLASVVAMEAAAFRFGQLARRLLAEHPEAGLVVQSASAGAYGGEGQTYGRLVLRASSVDAARAVADALGAELEEKPTPAGRTVYLYAHGTAEVDGFEVEVSGVTSYSGEEAEALLAEQAVPAEDGAL